MHIQVLDKDNLLKESKGGRIGSI
ncbi:hypothetical protein FB2170_05565 [Maribacter sp. HTCC2170]|nr:hypothetical protein FB2170_05565 [Maribacter sp. HTCC2170]